MTYQWPEGLSFNDQKTVKIPLQFHFEPVEIVTKQLTKLNSPSPYRIHYMGPRWENSLSLHKKFGNKGGYEFNDKQISKTNFVHDAMSHNQFYKNQLYYRAFEGVNPTINKEQQLWFESRFESGNLDCAIKVGPEQYDLFLRIDSNTRGHLFWFYFEVSNCKPNTIIKFNICNMSKSIGLYQQGFKPYCSIRNQNNQYTTWTQESCFDVTVTQKKLRYDFIYEKTNVRKLMQLSFKYKFEGHSPVRFAYCIPYTYSEMITQINSLRNRNPNIIKIGSLGKSLTGVNLPFLIVGPLAKLDQYKKQQIPVLVCIGRLHPGQTNGSHVLSGLMNYVCTMNEAAFIREKMITVFIPMLNPDGVIMGNSRTNAIGRDLNRQFKSHNKIILPEVCHLKQFCSRINQTNNIEMFLDFHGHSRKKNMFCFGPNYNITQAQYYRSRLFPKFLSQLTPIFRYFGCDYSIPQSKSTTARAVMIQQKIPYVYAMQTSIGQYFDYQTHKLSPFFLKKWLDLGNDVGRAIKQYFQSVHQFRDYVRSKAEESQISYNSKAISPSKNQRQKSLKVPPIRQIFSPEKYLNPIKDIKLIKALQQIKIVEQQRKSLKKSLQQFQNNSSDSQNEEDQLEKKKRSQFQVMLTQCIQNQYKKQREQNELLNEGQALNPKNTILKKNKKKIDTSIKKESEMMQKILKSPDKYASIVTQQVSLNNSNLKTKHKKGSHSLDSKQKQQKITYQQFNKPTSRTTYEEIQTKNVYFLQTFNGSINDKQTKNEYMNRWNLKMFNYSQVIQQVEDRTISTTDRKRGNRYLNLRQLKLPSGDSQRQYETFSFNSPPSVTPYDKKISNCQQIYKKREQTNQNEINSEKDSSIKKLKGVFPPSFYRIKFQNYQKKKQKISSQAKNEAHQPFNDQKLVQGKKKISTINIDKYKIEQHQG